jgi:hypothetical protein
VHPDLSAANLIDKDVVFMDNQLAGIGDPAGAI